MKKKIANLLIKYRKWLSVPIYMLAVLIIGLLRNTLIYPHLSDRLSSNIYDVLFTLLAIAGLVGVVYLCNSPFRKREFKQICEAVSLKTDNGKYARLVSVCNDPYKAHGKIYRVRNYHISMEYFDKKLTPKSATKFCIYSMEYNRNASQTILYVLDRKYIKPAIFTPDDIAIGSGGGTISELINMLVIGPTNSGKTVFMKILLYKLAKFTNKKIENGKFANSKFWILDFKQMDFSCLSECPRYFPDIDGCIQGFNEFYDAFESQRKSKTPSEFPCYLFIDEWAGLLQSLDNATASTMAKRLNTLLSVGRGVGYIPIIGLQKPNSKYFDSARENFSCCVALGSLSPEVKKMVAGDERDKLSKRNRKREAYLIFDGYDIEQIKVDTIHDLNAFDNEIRKLLSEGAGGEA